MNKPAQKYIAVLDQSERRRWGLKKLLNIENYLVLEVSNVEELNQIASKFTLGLILSVIDSAEAAETLQKHIQKNARFDDVPVIAMVYGAPSDDLFDFASVVIKAPFDLDALLLVVKTAFHEAKGSRSVSQIR